MLAGEPEVVGLHAARQQTVVADAVEAGGQHVAIPASAISGAACVVSRWDRA
jgi:hypothetical protein